MPAVREGWSLVRVMGAGLNRSELRTRQGHSPSVRFPRVLAIECVGMMAISTDPSLPEGTTVAAVMGEMGREFDGGYAEYALLPNALLMPVTTTLPWEVLAALPDTYLTAQGAFVLVDDGELPHTPWPDGPSHVLDLVGASTVAGSLRLVRQGGSVCVAGSLSGWLICDFEPIAMIPSGTRLTAFHSDDAKGSAGAAVLDRVVRNVEGGVYRPNLDRVYSLDDVTAAHRYMEDNQATGKAVMLPHSPS
jgi:NADPH:quinone reductase-like Zn-dependent oxidoreductase